MLLMWPCCPACMFYCVMSFDYCANKQTNKQQTKMFGCVLNMRGCCCSPGYKKTVPGEGMRCMNDPSKKGNLVIEFAIEFPHSLTPEKRALIRKALPK